MTTIKQTEYVKDAVQKRITVTRDFEAPVADVWDAWTKPELLDQWWAPRPWKAITQKMDFNEGGSWYYYMLGPEGERHYCRCDYKKIVPQKSYTGDDGFCDESGNFNKEMPIMHWHCDFAGSGDTTTVTVRVDFDSEDDMNKIVEMGFQEGFAAAHNNLDELLNNKK